MLHVYAAKRADSVAGRCSRVEPLAERGLFIFRQRIMPTAASLILQPMQAFSVVTLDPEDTSRVIAMLGAVKPWMAKMMIRKRFARRASFSFFSNRRDVSNVA
jgi:hypothetical protein